MAAVERRGGAFSRGRRDALPRSRGRASAGPAGIRPKPGTRAVCDGLPRALPVADCPQIRARPCSNPAEAIYT